MIEDATLVVVAFLLICTVLAIFLLALATREDES